MSDKTKKNNKHKNNVTQKMRTLPNLNKYEKAFICKKDYNVYNAFEVDFEKSDRYKQIKDQKDIQSEIIKILNSKTAPKHMNPNDDFYGFVNNLWLEKITKKEGEEYIVQVDDFRLVQNKVYHQLIGIVKDYIKNNHNEKAKQISNVYHSFLHLLDTKMAMKHIDYFLSLIDKFYTNSTDKSDAWKLLASINRNEVIAYGCPFVINIVPDNKNSTIFRANISPPQLSLIDIMVYIDDGTDIEYKKNYKKHYLQYINKLFDAFFGKDNKYKSQDVWDIEYDLLITMGCSKVKNESPDYYNRVEAKDAMSKYGFDWETFSKYYGFKRTPSFFIATSLNYLKCGSEWIMNNWGSEKLRTYFIYIYIRQIARFHKEFRDIPYEFCGKFERGQEKIFPAELEPVFGLAFSFNTFLTNEYVERYKNEQAVNYVKTMAEDLKTVFTRIIRRNTWLQPQTKKYALLKLKNFKLEVGSPKILEKDPLLEYSSTDPWENIRQIEAWRTERIINLEGEKVVDIPVIDWANYPLKLVSTQAYVVNASYTPSKNAIYIPLGYIQKPFIDLEERGIEYNLVFIGYTLGHEFSHSLDDMGSKFDHKGNMNNWWTKKDSEIFKKKQADVIKQYEEFAKRDGIIFDAEPSVGEDLADISGLAMCVEYLRDFQEKNDDIPAIRILSYKALFIYFAYQYRQKISKEALAAQLKTNPHPPDKYRTNIPLSRLKIYRDMYRIVKGDGMYWHNTDTIW